MKFITNFKTMCNYKRAHFGIQYEGESITSLNLRMNIHRGGKRGYEISIDHYRNVCKNVAFESKSLKSCHEIVMKMYRLQHEDYWMKTLHTVYPYSLNQKTKFMNEDSRKRILFPRHTVVNALLIPKYGPKSLIMSFYLTLKVSSIF